MMKGVARIDGQGSWQVKGAVVQASNLPGLGLITYGECWHNNHHAFPEWAQIGLGRGQADPAWYVLGVLERFGWVWNLGQPRPESEREDLSYVGQPGVQLDARRPA